MHAGLPARPLAGWPSHGPWVCTCTVTHEVLEMTHKSSCCIELVVEHIPGCCRQGSTCVFLCCLRLQCVVPCLALHCSAREGWRWWYGMRLESVSQSVTRVHGSCRMLPCHLPSASAICHLPCLPPHLAGNPYHFQRDRRAAYPSAFMHQLSSGARAGECATAGHSCASTKG